MKKVNCSKYSFEIQTLFDISVKYETEKYSKFICHKCVLKIRNINLRKVERSLKCAREIINSISTIWLDFEETDINCRLCDHYYRLTRRWQKTVTKPSFTPSTKCDVSEGDVVLATPTPPTQTYSELSDPPLTDTDSDMPTLSVTDTTHTLL